MGCSRYPLDVYPNGQWYQDCVTKGTKSPVYLRTVTPHEINMTEPIPNALELACREVAKQVLWNNGALSSDLVETLALKYLVIAESHQEFVRCQRESDDVIETAVRYIAYVHAIPPHGTDTGWFRDTLSALMEVAVPNTGLSEQAAQFLPCVQEGIRESLAHVAVPRERTRIEDEDALVLRLMQNAGSEHGVSADLLDLLEKLFHGDPLSEDDQRLFYLSSVAAPLTRNMRG